MGHFPFFMEIGGKKGMVVGGGRVAARKVEKLLPFGPVLTVIAPR
ncbi:MAG: NAD(P)-dependent oxidoreductase, partial [Lachnospiraceae bacterium]|nr:NAD(P)-dependent oxidoreductase [Lachnospiraceae bacterium]